MKTNRRVFLQSGIVGAAGIVMPRVWCSGTDSEKVMRDKFNVGLVGCGSRGYANGRDFAQLCKIVALCDVDRTHLARFAKDKKISPDPDKVFTSDDYRRLLDRKEIDIISISTVDHWHVKIAAEALLAGKHVFCEKPLSLTIAENRLIREVAASVPCQMAVGTQQRTMKDKFMTATLMVRAGLLGKIEKVTVHLIRGPQRGPFVTEPVPQDLNWERWQGPVPTYDYIKERCHRTFRYWYEYAGGQFTDWGAHHVDCAHWALGEDRIGCGPVEIDGRQTSHGTSFDSRGYPVQNDCFNTATDFHIKCRFSSGVKLDVVSSNENGILFEGTGGRIFVNRGKITGKLIEEEAHRQFTEEDFVKLNHGKPVESPKGNFLRSIREGGLPASDVTSHTIALNTCHLCGIAARLKRVIHWDPKSETIRGDTQASEFLAREARKGYELPKSPVPGNSTS